MSGIVKGMEEGYKVNPVTFLTAGAGGGYALGQLKRYQQDVRVDMTAGTATLVLPPVAEARGRHYSIRVTAGTNALTITAPDAIDQPTINTLDAANDRVTLYSDGATWHNMASDIA